MKKRLGFVSNSSSSSFVIEVDKEKMIEVKPQDILIKMFGGFYIETKDQLDKFFIERYGWDNIKSIEQLIESEGDWVKDRHDSYMKIIHSGKCVLCLESVEYDTAESVERLAENLNMNVIDCD